MKILTVYYSMYGHVLQLARAVEQGAKAVEGVDVILRRVAEFDDVIQKTADNEYIVKVREQQAGIPVCTLDDLREADGVIFGSPTRYGNMTAQMKQLIDSTATLWLKGEMEGKPAGVFTSTGSTHGGQETTLLTMMVPLIHLGMVIVGRAVFDRWDASHRSAGRHALWRNNHRWPARRIAADEGRSCDRECSWRARCHDS